MKPFTRKHSMVAALAACLLSAVACQSATVHGDDDTSVTATTVRSLTIKRGGTATLEVAINRRNMSGPVEVSVANLPNGVSADDASMHVETTGATFILRASTSADLVTNHTVDLTLEDPNGREVKQHVSLTVTQ
jgi:ABC-type glycerol-3-phosphate transport system substrate-binding protein